MLLPPPWPASLITLPEFRSPQDRITNRQSQGHPPALQTHIADTDDVLNLLSATTRETIAWAEARVAETNARRAEGVTLNFNMPEF
jgi:hypothetical protein